MRLNRINSLSFYGKIIDSHCHVGTWSENGKKRDYTNDLDTLIKEPLSNGDTVEKVIVSNLDCMVHNSENEVIEFLSDEITGNKRLLEMADKNPAIAPLATCQPGYGKPENIRTLLEENPNRFIGFKFHPEQLSISASDVRYNGYMDIAAEHKIPCLFHSARTYDVTYPGGGVGKASGVSTPKQIYELARRYKDVPVIMAHWGGDGEANIDYTTQCIIDSIKKKDATLYADISWVDCNDPFKPNLKRIIEKLKANDALDRILFGTDAPLGRFSEGGENGVAPKQAYEDMVINIKNMIRREFPNDAESIIDKIFYKNAADLFHLEFSSENLPKPTNESKPPRVSQPNQPSNNPSPRKGKWGWIIAGAILVVGAAVLYYKKHKKDNESKLCDIRA